MIYRNDTGDPLDFRSSYIVIIVLTYISAAVTRPYAKQCIQKLSQNETPLIPNYCQDYCHRTAIENTSNVCDSVYLKKAGAV